VSSGGGLDVPAYGPGWLACCAPNTAAVATDKENTNKAYTKMFRFIPTSFTRAKICLLVLDPAVTGKFCAHSLYRPQT
jgi:hypothetical protein